MSLRHGWRTLFLLMGLFACTVARAQSAGVEETMPEHYLPELKSILANALKQSPTTIARELEIEGSRARIYNANAARLPGVGGDFSEARNKTSNSGSNGNKSSTVNNGFFYSFGLSQSLFHWGALKNESEKARISVLISEKNYREAYRALAGTIRRSYLDLIVKKSLILQKRAVQSLKQAELKLIEEKVADGRAAVSEPGLKRLEIDDDNLALRLLEVEFAGARRDLARLAGVPVPTEDSIPSAIPMPNFRDGLARDLFAKFVQAGARSTFQAEMAEMRIRQADLDYRIARVRQLPKFNAGASYGLENTTNATANSVSQEAVTRSTVSVSAHWNIFDGLATRGEKLAALNAKRRLERDLQNLTDASLDAAQGLFDRLPLEVEAMRLADIHRGLSDALVKKLQSEFELGNVPKNSVAMAETAVKAGDYSNFAARASFLSRWSEFVSLTTVDPVLSNIPTRYDREKR